MNYRDLIEKAFDAQEGAYTPYSHFNVGAALEMEDGTIFTGCNIENASYTPTVCAERVAIFKAVSEGHRKIKTIAIVGGENTLAYPCGVCRQVIREFGPESTIIVAKALDDYQVFKLNDLLPNSFGPEDLE